MRGGILWLIGYVQYWQLQIILMRLDCFHITTIAILLLLASVQAQEQPSLAPAGEINHISFSESHLFYLSRTGRHFGFISRQSGEIMSKYQLKDHESIISVDKASNSVILRSARTRVVLFDISSFHQEELNVQIAFKHQQIIDVLKMNGKYFVLTDKDVRMYDQNEQKKGESLKNIISSGRKNEFFKKMFLRQGEKVEDMVIVLIKNGDVCIRSFKKIKKGVDECFFKVPYEITGIQRINQSILIQTSTVNYVISQEPTSTYSFQGKITQFNGQFIQLAEFKTYDLQNQIFLDGIIVEGSTKEQMFWIHAPESNKITVFYNSVLVSQKVVEQLPRRSWIAEAKAKGGYDLLLEFQNNRFEMYQISLEEGKPVNFSLKWSNKSLQNPAISSQL